MPRLEQKEDGDYYIRAYIHSKERVFTWQVLGSGLTYLNKHEVYPGNRFPMKLLQDMIAAKHVFTGGSGAHLGTADRQSRSFIPKTVSVKNVPSLKISPPQKGEGNVKPATIIRKSTSLVFRKYKKRWELLLVFPELSVDESKEFLTSGCRLTGCHAESCVIRRGSKRASAKQIIQA